MLTRKKNKQTNHSLGGNKGHVDSDRTGNKVTDGGLVQDEGTHPRRAEGQRNDPTGTAVGSCPQKEQR